MGEYEPHHAALLSFYNHAATPWCHLPAFAPMPAMHAHACNIPSSDAGLLNPRTEELLPLLTKKAAISTFYLQSQIIIPNLLP